MLFGTRVRYNRKNVKRQLKEEFERELAEKRKAALSRLADNTPKATGYAASRWSAGPVDPKNGFEVHNDASYIDDLNAGHSDQAPRRFIESTAMELGRPTGSIVKYGP